jgi:asparagine synthase (glutamine-hydrolysing)
MGSWIRHDLRPLVDSLLSEAQVKTRGLFNWSTIKEMVLMHHAQKADYTDQLLALINLEVWCQIFLDSRDYREPLEMAFVGEHRA